MIIAKIAKVLSQEQRKLLVNTVPPRQPGPSGAAAVSRSRRTPMTSTRGRRATETVQRNREPREPAEAILRLPVQARAVDERGAARPPSWKQRVARLAMFVALHLVAAVGTVRVGTVGGRTRR